MLVFPEYAKHKDWYYYDPRYLRDRLTDKITEEGKESYLKGYSLIHPHIPYEKIESIIEKDILNYKKNKHRYTFEKDEEFGIMHLVAIDGKEVEPLSEEELDYRMYNRGCEFLQEDVED